MLDFEFTDEQNLIRKTLRDSCRAEIQPVVTSIDEEKRIPDDLIRGMSASPRGLCRVQVNVMPSRPTVQRAATSGFMYLPKKTRSLIAWKLRPCRNTSERW